MRCVVNLTPTSQPEWITDRLPISPAKVLERKLVDIFSSPMSELTLAAPIPLPTPLFGEHAQLPVIKGVVTHLNFQKGFARIVLGDSTKKALGLTYLHFLGTWPMRYVKPSMKQSFQAKFMNMVNTTQFEMPCENIQCAIPSGCGDLPMYYESRLPRDDEFKEVLASIVWRIRSFYFVGISADKPWSTIWDIPFIVPMDEIMEYSHNKTGPKWGARTKQKMGDRKVMKNSKRLDHRRKRPASATPEQYEDTITIAPYHSMTTRMNSSQPLSPISTSTKRLNRFRSANVSQNARGGKVRFPSVSDDSASSHDSMGDIQSMEGKKTFARNFSVSCEITDSDNQSPYSSPPCTRES